MEIKEGTREEKTFIAKCPDCSKTVIARTLKQAKHYINAHRLWNHNTHPMGE